VCISGLNAELIEVGMQLATTSTSSFTTGRSHSKNAEPPKSALLDFAKQHARCTGADLSGH